MVAAPFCFFASLVLVFAGTVVSSSWSMTEKYHPDGRRREAA